MREGRACHAGALLSPVTLHCILQRSKQSRFTLRCQFLVLQKNSRIFFGRFTFPPKSCDSVKTGKEKNWIPDFGSLLLGSPEPPDKFVKAPLQLVQVAKHFRSFSFLNARNSEPCLNLWWLTVWVAQLLEQPWNNFEAMLQKLLSRAWLKLRRDLCQVCIQLLSQCCAAVSRSYLAL